MTEKILGLYRKYKELLSYLFFGGLTTAVNFIVYYVCIHAFGAHYIASQVISWIFAVAFAFVTNKLFVFESKSKEHRIIFLEIIAFAGVRLFSFGVETLLLWFQVEIIALGEDIAKIPASVVTVILNYITGKLVFRKK